MAFRSSALIISPQSKPFKAFDMSSSPLPSLSDLVMNVKGVKSSEVMILEPVDNLPQNKTKSETVVDAKNTNRNHRTPNSNSENSKISPTNNNSQETSRGENKGFEVLNSAKNESHKAKPKEIINTLPDHSHPPNQVSKNSSKTVARGPASKKVKNKPINKTQMCFPKGKVIKPHLSVTSKSNIEGLITNDNGNFSINLSASSLADTPNFSLERMPLGKVIIESNPDEGIHSRSSPDHPSNLEEEGNQGFSNLFGRFGYKKTAVSIEDDKTQGGIKKGKLIELMNSNATTKTKLPKKDNTGRKRAKTITNQAISVFCVDDKPIPAPLSDYFPLQTVKRNSASRLLKSEKKGLKGSKSSSKPSSKSLDTNNNSRTTLLSPSSALKQVDQQDFIFGTSSQLAKEDSPTLLREIHDAMQISNCLDDPFASSPIVPSFKSTTTNRNLWTAASRDVSGSLLDVETIDLLGSQTDRDVIISSPISAHESWHDISSSPLAQQKIITHNNIETIGKASDPLPLNSASPLKKDMVPIKAASKKRAKSQAPTLKAAEKTPNFDSFTNAQLAKEIAVYHFKPVKKREQMITLLQQCWEGKQRMKSGTTDKQDTLTNDIITSSEIDESSEKSPKTKDKRLKSTKGKKSSETNDKVSISQTRKRKKSTKLTDDLADFSDYDTQITPPRSRKISKSWSSTPSPCLPDSESEDSSQDLSPASNSRILYTHITQAIKASASSKDSSKPSWHEKILLYDPIVLEDLTAWLNMGALQKANWDREVELKDVKKWCESKSICCLSRESLRNGSRNRY
ncbi:hypothetical protein K3495_g9924 [Podosphaera aphanis]|nr:hypothetical protein K3495_g9924 [Podosphaera aphanis]